ncbi:MAG TPA: peptidylprolyl isomerase [Patescibacteria group bacterium]|nr:peptidylprolyl isomerase [Patescibacteria group bacterium]
MKNLFFAAILAVMAYGCATTPTQTQTNTNTGTTKNTDTPGTNRPRYTISVTQKGVSLGNIVVEMFPDVAPKHVRNFDSLVSIGFYDGTAFHRVIPGFVIQGGDPASKTEPRERWGFGMPGQTRVPAEFNKIPHTRGIISAARSNDPNSASSQFFICVDEAASLNEKYTVYGQVVSGMEVADIIVNSPRDTKDNPIDKISMTITKNK